MSAAPTVTNTTAPANEAASPTLPATGGRDLSNAFRGAASQYVWTASRTDDAPVPPSVRVVAEWMRGPRQCVTVGRFERSRAATVEVFVANPRDGLVFRLHVRGEARPVVGSPECLRMRDYQWFSELEAGMVFPAYVRGQRMCGKFHVDNMRLVAPVVRGVVSGLCMLDDGVVTMNYTHLFGRLQGDTTVAFDLVRGLGAWRMGRSMVLPISDVEWFHEQLRRYT